MGGARTFDGWEGRVTTLPATSFGLGMARLSQNMESLGTAPYQIHKSLARTWIAFDCGCGIYIAKPWFMEAAIYQQYIGNSELCGSYQ